MPATEIIPQVVVLTGIVPTIPHEDVEPAGNFFENSGRCFIHVKNAHADEARTVTVVSQVDCNYGENHPAPVTILAAEDEKMFGPFPKSRFNDEDGYAQITYSDSGADLKIAVIEVP